MNFNSLVFGLIALTPITHSIADDIKLGLPIYGGSGCPSGSASATLSPDSKELSILFDQYAAEAGGDTGKRVDRKTCNFAIPLHIPQGYSFSIVGIDYRGFASVPARASARFSVEYFIAGGRGPMGGKTFYGPVDEDYTLRHELGVGAIVWSACGGDVNLRTNSSMTAITNSRFEQTLATVDSVDISAGILYHIQWRQCR
jgi:hypothetical protein